MNGNLVRVRSVVSHLHALVGVGAAVDVVAPSRIEERLIGLGRLWRWDGVETLSSWNSTPSIEAGVEVSWLFGRTVVLLMSVRRTLRLLMLVLLISRSNDPDLVGSSVVAPLLDLTALIALATHDVDGLSTVSPQEAGLSRQLSFGHGNDFKVAALVLASIRADESSVFLVVLEHVEGFVRVDEGVPAIVVEHSEGLVLFGLIVIDLESVLATLFDGDAHVVVHGRDDLVEDVGLGIEREVDPVVCLH